MDILGMLKGFFNEDKIKEIAKKVGVPEDKVSGIVDNYLPSLLNQITEKVGSGKTAILGFLDKDGDGDFMDDLQGMFGGKKKKAEPMKAAASAADVFEDKAEEVAETIGKEAGVKKEQAANVMDEITKQVMGFFGDKKGEGAFDLKGLIGSLTSQKGDFKEKITGQLGFLDKDGDGDVVDDLKDIGKNLFGGLFGKRK